MTILLALLACGGEDKADTCEAICDELVMACAYEAYPTYDSCIQGCLYKEEQGANMGRAWQCIQGAECDTFQIIECEHAEGVDTE